MLNANLQVLVSIKMCTSNAKKASCSDILCGICIKNNICNTPLNPLVLPWDSGNNNDIITVKDIPTLVVI